MDIDRLNGIAAVIAFCMLVLIPLLSSNIQEVFLVIGFIALSWWLGSIVHAWRRRI